MAFNRRTPYWPMIHIWNQNVGRMLGHAAIGAEVWINCSRCGTRSPVDLAKLVRDRGPLFSLWNRQPPCPTCEGRRFFTGHHGPDTFVRPFTTEIPSQTDYLHALYERLKDKA